MSWEPRVTVPVRSLRRFAGTVKNGQGRIKIAFNTWSRIYAAFIRTRFIKFSRGGGNWRRLAASTIAARRRGKRRGPIAILRDTGLLFASLNPSVILIRESPLKLSVIFGGSRKYPDGTSVTDVMIFHNFGGGHVPKRQILVGPDAATEREMRRVMDAAIAYEAKKA